MSSDAPHPLITRHFATIDGTRQVHYRRAGKGPPVLLAHQSPTSGREHIPLIEYLANDFTVIAPDTPGNGQSDPLPDPNATMDDYGDNLAKLLKVLGIPKVACYGFHSGSSVLAGFATRHPEMVHGAILNGFVAQTPEERAERMAAYLIPVPARWDGAHLVQIWARIREQYLFGAWHNMTRSGRSLQREFPPVEYIQWQMMEWLRSGDTYRLPYGAVFNYPGDEVAKRFRTPTIVCASDFDGLVKHLDRLKDLPDCVKIERIGPDPAAVFPFIKQRLARFAKGDTPPPAPKPQPLKSRATQDYVSVGGGQLHMRWVEGTGRPVVITADAASDNSVTDAVTSGFLGQGPAYAIDLPGIGESDNIMGPEALSIARFARALGGALDALDIREVDALGIGGGAAEAVELALLRPDLVKRLALVGPLNVDTATAFEMADRARPLGVEAHGGHLLRVWHMVRDEALFFPGHRRTRDSNVYRHELIQTDMVHRRTVAAMKSGDMLQHRQRAQALYRLADVLPRVAQPVQVSGAKEDGAHLPARDLAKGKVSWTDVPEAMADWPKALVPFLKG